MDTWILLALSIILSFALAKLAAVLISNGKNQGINVSLPPGPPSIPVIGSTMWFTNTRFHVQTILPGLFAKYGPVVALPLPFTSVLAIFISNRSLAHQALVQRGSALSNRVSPGSFIGDTPYDPRYCILRHNLVSSVSFVLSHSIGDTPYGPRYHILRRNLISSVVHPSKLRTFAIARELTLRDLISNLKEQALSSDCGAVRVRESLCSAVNRLHTLMCFGEKLDEEVMNKVEQLQKALVASIVSSDSSLFRVIMSGLITIKGNKHEQLQKKLKEILTPLMMKRQERFERDECNFLLHSYVDALQQVEVPDQEGARRLTADEKLDFSCEFLMATDATITALEWIMANIIIHQGIQEKLWQEIKGVIKEKKAKGEEGLEMLEEEVEKMPYLKAVILEGLRRHPPSQALIPRVAAEDVVLDDRYLIPKGSFVGVSLADIGRDEEAWDEPMQFKPERFLDSKGEEVGDHLMGGKEAKMIPFGTGTRICPGIGMAVIHLKFFVANLVKEFKWKALDDQEELDLSEELMLTTVMKVPLRAQIFPRINV